MQRHTRRISKTFICGAAILVTFAVLPLARAQKSAAYRVGVITAGGAWYATIDGLRAGLKEFGLEEGKHLLLDIRETRGDVNAAEAAAKSLEGGKVHVIYTTQTSISIAAKKATMDIPVVFCAGADPVSLGLVESWAKPGGRLTGVYEPGTDLTAKRLEHLKEIVHNLRRAVTFYVPNHPVSLESSKFAREAARQMGIQLFERHVASIKELDDGLRALKPGDVDAFFEVSDAMVQLQDQLVIEATTKKKLPTMFNNQNSVLKGGLASYSANRFEIGRLSAKYVHRVLEGTKPKDLPVEAVRKMDLVINLKTAKQIGLTIPQSVLYKADRVIK